MSAIIPFNEQERMADAIAKSGMFGLKDKVAVLALMAVAQAEGRHPASVARDYHIIEGRPALKADAMLARFQQAGGSVEWLVYTDEKVEAKFSHPQGGSLTLAWTFKQAMDKGIATGRNGPKDNWAKYPRPMLRARVISEGIRTVYPGIIVGEYTPEEVQDFDVKPMKTVSVPHVEITDELSDVAELVFPFFVPNVDGSPKLYKACRDLDEFKEFYSDMVEKICASKMSGEMQDSKIKALEAVNVEMLKMVRGE